MAISRTELRERVNAFPFWYHRIDLGGGLVTPGWAPLKAKSYHIPSDLTGLRVLDVGAWDGYWSFEALKRGAREVVAVDDFSDFVGRNVERHAWDTFDLCREALGFGEDRCKRVEMDVYEIDEAKLGRFDVVFCFGVVYHLRHPLLGLDRLSAVCDDAIFVESAILDDYSPYRHEGYGDNQMIMEFYPGDQYGRNETNWWVPTLACLGHMVKAAGFPHIGIWKLDVPAAERVKPRDCRGFVAGRKRAPIRR